MTTPKTFFDLFDDDFPDSNTSVPEADAPTSSEKNSPKKTKKILKTAKSPAAPEKKTLDAIPEVVNPLSVSELTGKVKKLVETHCSDIWVIGQISNLSLPRSGHIYLTLKDENAQLPAVLWKSAASKLRFKLNDGMEVVCRGRLDVYPPQGKYQMIVEEIEPKGIGTLELAFRQLHDKLAGQGLFAAERKKSLPRFVRRIALITSPSGAAVRDFLQVLARRTRQIDILLVPVRVQGDGASDEIAAAIQTVNRINRFESACPIDCIVVSRGGGSVEDLWAFNEESLVRAVADSSLPVVSGVGHEIDVTLCDLAADVRALTPSEAAERISLKDDDLVQELVLRQRRMENQINERLRFCKERIRFFENHPALLRPEQMIEQRETRLDVLEERLDRSCDRHLIAAAQRLGGIAASLEALSPLAVLKRGYSLTETDAGQRIRHIGDIEKGSTIKTVLTDGTILSIVKEIQENKNDVSE